MHTEDIEYRADGARLVGQYVVDDGKPGKRPGVLLVHRREMGRLTGAIQREGMTLVPLRLYFNARGIAKVQLGLAKGKKLHDKRETVKKRDWERQKGRLMRDKG